ncbi:MAG: hypothetical protein ACXAD7_19210 [Candidatus Kariarchaeaceae archaeon]
MIKLKEFWTLNRKASILIIVLLLIMTTFATFEIIEEIDEDEDDDENYTEFFNLENLNFSSTGKNDFFILEPGYQLTLEGEEDDESILLVITVLNETEMVGDVETRIVEERETVNGELYEVSRNFFAIDNDTHSVFYFGEEVDYYEDGLVVRHEGEWRADETGNQAGLMMPGIILLGARFYQEIAPDKAMDQAEIVSNTETVVTTAGSFTNCVKFKERNPLDGESEFKIFAPGIGLVVDEFLRLTSFGFVSL